MSGFQVNQDLIFTGSDLLRPRMAVEKEKMARSFPGFHFYGSETRVTSVQGYLTTSYGGNYHVKIEIGTDYPYGRPSIYLPTANIAGNTPHRFNDGSICVMRREQWSSTLSLAFLVAKAAIWVNKYDSWIQNGKGRWPGKGQAH